MAPAEFHRVAAGCSSACCAEQPEAPDPDFLALADNFAGNGWFGEQKGAIRRERCLFDVRHGGDAFYLGDIWVNGTTSYPAGPQFEE